MKKLGTIALVCMAVLSAQATSFTWKATKVAFDGTQLKSDASVSAYLVYLSSGAYDSSYALSESMTGESLASTIGTTVSSASKTSGLAALSGTATFTFGDYNNGDVFGMLLVYSGSSDGKTYYNLSSDTYALSGLSDETSTPPAATFTFDYASKNDSGSSISKGGGWTAVPEPSTAMLALAGLALLIKRRRA